MLRFFLIASLAALALIPHQVDAAGRRRVATLAPARMTVPPSKPAIAVASASTLVSFSSESPDALDEVNQARAARGLPPFIKDQNLTIGALNAARARASHHISGHLPNDFHYLPPGSVASAAGCGALTPDWGWGSCCTYDRYTYAGAAFVWGHDGKRYMHLFVR